MPSQSSSELLEKLEVRLRINQPGASREENDKATALELFARASGLNEAIHALRLPYTYQIIPGPPEKVKARQQLGMMVCEILEGMRDEFVTAAIANWPTKEPNATS